MLSRSWSQPVEYYWQQIIRAWDVMRQLELEDGDAGVPAKAGS